jgi:hypothetical protein
MQLMNTQRKASPLPPNAEIASLIPVHKPSFGLDLPTDKTTKDGVKVTWLGYANLCSRLLFTLLCLSSLPLFASPSHSQLSADKGLVFGRF